MNYFKRFSFLCGLALIMLAAFPVFAQTDSKIEVKRAPLRNFSRTLTDQVQNKELDLSENFSIEISGELTKEGKFDSAKTKVVKTEGSKKLIEVAKDAIIALSDSGIFGYLKQLEISKINLTLAQTDSEINFVIKSETISDNKAKTLSSLFNTLISTGKMQAKNDNDKILLNGTNISVDGKSVIIKTSVEKSVGQEMIQRQLKKGSVEQQPAGIN